MFCWPSGCAGAVGLWLWWWRRG